ncbi:MAG TPA: PFL family protein [Methanocella sp.]|uniref:PFL family protein n=1 Tax=Methanocella sp. TaxID=2052833 RepID=UPI002CC1AE9E|nr:PFL family protein [Methanocella sp.]HTY90010.1 PFL family protein [Methanocella sp.]
MIYSIEEILETVHMIQAEHLDIRTVTMGISLRGCISDNIRTMNENIYETVTARAENLVSEAKAVEEKFGIPIVNKRISVTPVASLLDTPLAGKSDAKAIEGAVSVARTLDRAAKDLNIDFIGGYSALVHKGFTSGDSILISSIPEALTSTDRVCSSVNVATTKSGINMDAILLMGQVIKKTAAISPVGCAKLVVFANAPSDNPFMAGAFHGEGEPENVINVGISGPGVVRAVLSQMDNSDLGELSETIKRTSFKITRMGELVGREMAQRLNVEFGIVDLSLAPTPAEGDSVANILEVMGLEKCGTHGTTAALALLTDAVKKGGAMATSYTGGLSGAFIPVSEDAGMVDAVKSGAIGIDKLEAMTSVCSVGLDMLVVPGDTSPETLSAIIADECAIGMINSKTTGVRIIPAGKEGEYVEFGGLLGGSYVMPLNKFSSAGFVRRGGRIPAPIQSFRN